jgi:hypothetical protein
MAASWDLVKFIALRKKMPGGWARMADGATITTLPQPGSGKDKAVIPPKSGHGLRIFGNCALVLAAMRDKNGRAVKRAQVGYLVFSEATRSAMRPSPFHFDATSSVQRAGFKLDVQPTIQFG